MNERGEVLVEGKDYTLTYSAGRKAVGTYQVVVKYKGQYVDYANVKKTFDIVPQGTELKKLSPGKKKLTITWKKQTKETSGYQIQCSLKKNFKQVATVTVSGKKKSKVSLSGLKAKKNYFVRIRTYKNVKTNGKTVKSYSNWSDVKKIKTK